MNKTYWKTISNTAYYRHAVENYTHFLKRFCHPFSSVRKRNAAFSLQLSFSQAVFPHYSTHALTFVLNIYNNQCKSKHKIHLSLHDERERNSFLHTKLITEKHFLINITVLCQSSTLYFKLRKSVLQISYPHLAALHQEFADNKNWKTCPKMFLIMTAFNLPFSKNLQSTFYYGTIAPSKHMCQPFSQHILLDKVDEEKVLQLSLFKVYHWFSTYVDQSFLSASITLKN